LATPTVDGNGWSTGTEIIRSLQTLARSYTNSAGQTTHTDGYFNLSGLTCSTSTTLGTENTHFYRTRYAFDSRGRLARVQSPTGTIYRFVYDSLHRLSSKWVGTNDTPPSGEWSPTNNGAPSNMVKVAEYVCDGCSMPDRPSPSLPRAQAEGMPSFTPRSLPSLPHATSRPTGPPGPVAGRVAARPCPRVLLP
jgi:YD repeat-containing protein